MQNQSSMCQSLSASMQGDTSALNMPLDGKLQQDGSSTPATGNVTMVRRLSQNGSNQIIDCKLVMEQNDSDMRKTHDDK